MIIDQLKYKIDIDLKGFKDGVQTVKNESGKLSTILDRSNRETKRSAKESSLSLESFSKSSVNSFKRVGVAAASFLGIGIGLEAFRRGIVSTTNSMVDLGVKSSFLGMGAKNLDGFNRGFTSFGSSAERAESTLMKLQESMLFKKNTTFDQPAIFAVLEEISTLTHEKINDAKNAEEALFGLAKGLNQMTRDSAMAYNIRLGGIFDPATFNAVMDGTFIQKIEKMKATSTVSQADTDKAQKLAIVMAKLDQSMDNLRNSFFLTFGDGIAEAFDKLSTWLVENKDGIIGFLKECKEILIEIINFIKTIVGGSSKAWDGFTSFVTGANKIGGNVKNTLGISSDPNSKSTYKSIQDTLKGKAPEAVPTNSGATIGASGRYVPVFQPKDGEVVRDGSGGRYYATTDEYKDANGNIINPVQTDVGFQSMDRILDAVAYRESRGDLNAKNPHSSATGMYQFTTASAKHWGLRVDDEVDERLDPVKSRAAAEKYFRFLLKKYNGNVADAIAAYGVGPTGLDRYITNGTGVNSESINSVYQMTPYLKQMNLENSKFHQRATQTTSNAMNINTVNINNPVGELSQIQDQVSFAKMNAAWGG